MARIPVVPVDGTSVSAAPNARKRIEAESTALRVFGPETDVTLSAGESVEVAENVKVETAEPAKGFALVSDAGLPVLDGTVKSVEAALIAHGLATR